MVTKRLLLLLLLIGMVAAVHLSGLSRYVTLESLTEHRDLIEQAVARHYVLSVLLYMLLYILTALALPGALVLTVAGGVLFHTVPGAIYSSTGAIMGGVFAFVMARYIMGNWLQTRYAAQLRQFNAELEQHGHLYVMTARLIPIFPFLVVSYVCGLTRLKLTTFTWATAAGIFPACLVYTFAGSQIGSIASLNDLFTPRLLVSLLLLGSLPLLPMLWKKLRARRQALPEEDS
jgi:uncharacterized membrane protein YdjX (TVP38/TMEM64 family)